ncbi:Solute carrier family 11 member 1, partial [Balamuthia mandrillaris]
AWKRVLITRSVAIIPAIIVAVAAQSRLDTLDEWLNVLQSIQLPFALLPVLEFSNQRNIMGDFRNRLFVRLLLWLISAMVVGVNVYQLYATILLLPSGSSWWWLHAIVYAVTVPYFLFILYLAIGIENFRRLSRWVREKLCCCCCRSRGGRRRRAYSAIRAREEEAEASEGLVSGGSQRYALSDPVYSLVNE